MFGRNMDNVKKYLEEIDARFTIMNFNGLEQIYVFDKDAYDKVKKHPRKYKDLYVPYLRISDHGGDGLYTRRDGVTGEMTDDEIEYVIDELTFDTGYVLDKYGITEG